MTRFEAWLQEYALRRGEGKWQKADVEAAFRAGDSQGYQRGLAEAVKVPMEQYYKHQASSSSTHDDKLMDFALTIEHALRTLQDGA